MRLKKIQHVKLWMVMVTAAVFWTIGAGFFGDLSAKSDESYEGLKIFSDVIQLIEKEYVDDVESKELIQKAIQGMVQSLDPHSSLLPPEAFNISHRRHAGIQSRHHRPGPHHKSRWQAG
jgi:carboxyl-terminal processing protease